MSCIAVLSSTSLSTSFIRPSTASQIASLTSTVATFQDTPKLKNGKIIFPPSYIVGASRSASKVIYLPIRLFPSISLSQAYVHSYYVFVKFNNLLFHHRKSSFFLPNVLRFQGC